jgi:hypothetical protein
VVAERLELLGPKLALRQVLGGLVGALDDRGWVLLRVASPSV